MRAELIVTFLVGAVVGVIAVGAYVISKLKDMWW